MKACFLETVDLCKTLDGFPILNQINLRIMEHEIHMLIGENGAGKSKLMEVLSGTIPFDSGEIRVHGSPACPTSPQTALALGIYYIHAGKALFENMNVIDNFSLSLRARKANIFLFPHLAKKQLDTVRKRYDILQFDEKTPAKAFLPMQRLELELARAIVSGAKLLLLDEPTAGLNDIERKRFYCLIEQLKDEGFTILLSGHEPSELLEHSDRLTVINDGRITLSCTNDKENKQMRSELFHAITGIEFSKRYPKLRIPIGKEILRVRRFSDGMHFFDIDLSLHAGEIIGLAGLHGSGIEDLLKSIAGMGTVAGGQMTVNGKNAVLHSHRDANRHGICYLTNELYDEGLVKEKPITQNITLSNLKRLQRRRSSLRLLDGTSEKKYAQGFADALHIKNHGLSRPLETLSAGNQKKVLLAKSLFTEPNILLLNDPACQIDIAAKVDLFNILNGLLKQGVGIILVSSNLSELAGMCDCVYVMKKGRITNRLMCSDPLSDALSVML